MTRAGVGAAGGALYGAGEAAKHRARFGKDQLTGSEIKAEGKLREAKLRMKRNPSYINKIRLAKAKAERSMAQADREHPTGLVLRRAGQGAAATTLAPILAKGMQAG